MKKFTLAPEMEVTKLLNDQDIQEWQVEDTPSQRLQLTSLETESRT